MNNINDSDIITIQKWYRGCKIRLNLLPTILRKIQKFLINNPFKFCYINDDGRINSCYDEDVLIDKLINYFGPEIIKKPPKLRMWFDILVKDKYYGWLPVDIKSTTTNTNDNIGNFAQCVYAYTDEKLDFESKYDNGEMSKIIIRKLKNKEFNKSLKKDTYFLVLNKSNEFDIIINSMKGLQKLTPNINNLPFQVCWNKNRKYEYKNIKYKIKDFLYCITKPNPSWKETFLHECRKLTL